jgi:hypothetical protein
LEHLFRLSSNYYYVVPVLVMTWSHEQIACPVLIY